MSACVDIEVRPQVTSSLVRAKQRDQVMQEFERQFADWSFIAKVACAIEKDRDWELLGFRSFGAYLVARCNRSRSYLYLVMGRYKELKDDFSDEELSEIDLDSTSTLRKLSPAVRRDPEVREAAKKKPRDLRRVVVEKHPEMHIEDEDFRVLKFETSDAEDFDEALKVWHTLNNPEAPAEEFIRELCVEYVNSQWEDSGYSRKQRAEQLEKMASEHSW